MGGMTSALDLAFLIRICVAIVASLFLAESRSEHRKYSHGGRSKIPQSKVQVGSGRDLS
jgi:hypothetical protein